MNRKCTIPYEEWTFCACAVEIINMGSVSYSMISYVFGTRGYQHKPFSDTAGEYTKDHCKIDRTFCRFYCLIVSIVLCWNLRSN